MFFRRRPVFSILLALSLFTVPFVRERAQTGTRPTANNRTIILTASRTEQGGYIEPVVILERGRYLTPPDDDKELNDQYFKPGQKYRLLQGGLEVGTALVEKPTEKGCSQLGAADVKFQADAQVEQALATNSATLGRPASARRTPTASERESAVNIARTIFRRNRVQASLLKDVGTSSLIAADLDNDGRAELIGNFYIGMGPQEGVPDHILFLVMEPQGQSFRASLSRYHRIKNKYTNDGTLRGEDFLDHLDLDGDRADEIFVRFSVWEAWYFGIYKKQRGRWKLIYEGAGGGC